MFHEKCEFIAEEERDVEAPKTLMDENVQTMNNGNDGEVTKSVVSTSSTKKEHRIECKALSFEGNDKLYSLCIFRE